MEVLDLEPHSPLSRKEDEEEEGEGGATSLSAQDEEATLDALQAFVAESLGPGGGVNSRGKWEGLATCSMSSLMCAVRWC